LDILLQVTTAQILVPVTAACMLAVLAAHDNAGYLWKWSLWWAIWSLRYVAGQFASNELWFQTGLLPASAIAAGFLVVWGALQARDRPMPRWGVVVTVAVVLTWLVQTVSGRMAPLSTAALIVPAGYMAVCLWVAAFVLYQRDEVATLRREERAVASVIIGMAILQSSFPWVAFMDDATRALAGRLSTALQLLITVAVVRLHFVQVQHREASAHRQLEQQLAKALDDFIPLCMGCKNVRIEDGPWQTLEGYLSERTGTEVSHGLCPACLPRLYPDFADSL